MSDERLREAERKWKESGSVDDEARYLLERVRVGDLTRERLELAAYCGHQGARSATGAREPAIDLSTASREQISAWTNGLVSRGPQARGIAFLVLAEAAVERLERTGARDERFVTGVLALRNALAQGTSIEFPTFGGVVEATTATRGDKERDLAEVVFWGVASLGSADVMASRGLADNVVRAQSSLDLRAVQGSLQAAVLRATGPSLGP